MFERSGNLSLNIKYKTITESENSTVKERLKDNIKIFIIEIIKIIFF